MKFYSGRGVLEYWYTFGYAVKNYAIPGVFISDDDEVPPPSINPNQCDYPDWWYTWIDIDKIVMKLTRTEHILIIYYFTNVYTHERTTTEVALDSWNQKNRFIQICDRVYRMLDKEEYKPKRRSLKYTDFERTLKDIREKVRTGEIDVTIIDKNKFYTVTEVAEILRYTTRTIRRILGNGELKGFKIAGAWRIAGSALLDLIGGNNEEA